MKKRVRNLFRGEKGNALVLMALGMTIFLGLVSLVTDVGIVYTAKFRLVNALDSAALAGAQELPDYPELAAEIAKQYAADNGVPENNTIVEAFNSNRSLRVKGVHDVNLLFAPFIGISTGSVSHQAVASVAPITTTDNIVPLGLQEQQLIFGEQYTIKVGAGESETGWFGALALTGPGAKRYEDDMMYGYEEMVSVGNDLNIETGNISGPTKSAIDYRIAMCNHTPSCTVDRFNKECQRLIKLPVIEKTSSGTVKVIGFAMLLLDDATEQGNECYVKGKFVKTVISGKTNELAPNFGVLGVRLVE